MEFKDILKLLILEKTGGNQTLAAKESGIPIPTINGWLTKGRLPRYEQLIQLCHYFDVSADYLLGLETESGAKMIGESQKEYSADDLILAGKINELSSEKRTFIAKIIVMLNDIK